MHSHQTVSPKGQKLTAALAISLLSMLTLALMAVVVNLTHRPKLGAASRESELALMAELADETAQRIEAVIDDTDTKLLREIQIDPLSDLPRLLGSTGAAVSRVMVLDDKLQIIPGGNVSTGATMPSSAFTEYFMKRILPELQLPKQAFDERGHLFLREASKPGQPQGRWYLFSFMKRQQDDRTFYVVIEDDKTHLFRLFGQFLSVANGKRMYQIVDETGQLVYGIPFAETARTLVVQRPFHLTLDGWTLRITQKDNTDKAAFHPGRSAMQW